MRHRPVLAALALLTLGSAAGCGGGEPPGTSSRTAPAPATAPDRDARQPTLRQRVGQAVILTFEGTSAPEYVLRALREGRVAGVILFGDNITSPQQLRSLTRDLQRAARGSALVMADQEGGSVRVVSFAGPESGQSNRSSAAQTRTVSRASGLELRRLGINVVLTPVADIVSGPGAALTGRAFPGDAGAVAQHVTAAVKGYEAAGVAATAKHFPGLGAARVNTDDGAATIDGLGDGDLAPFRAAIAARTPLIMAGHALYPGVDRERIASQSPQILGRLLRERLGFEGVVVTDSMEAQAVLDRSSLTVAAERSLLAGVDLVLMTGDGSFRPVSLHLAALARRSPAMRARLEESNARVAALRQRLKLRPAR